MLTMGWLTVLVFVYRFTYVFLSIFLCHEPDKAAPFLKTRNISSSLICLNFPIV